MRVQDEIKKYIASQPDAKRDDMQALHSGYFICCRDASCGFWMVPMTREKSSATRI